MWSVRSEVCRLYIGRNLVVAASPGRVLRQGRPEGQPLKETLGAMDLDARGAAVAVLLGCAVSPLVCVEYPPTVRKFKERLLFAGAACARHMVVAPSSLHVEFDPAQPQVAAPMLRDDREAIGVWSRRHSLRLSRVVPAWCCATELASSSAASSLLVQDTDGLTLMVSDAAGKGLRGSSAPCGFGLDPDPLLRRMRVGLGLPTAASVHLRFTPPEEAERKTAWDDCWSVVA